MTQQGLRLKSFLDKSANSKSEETLPKMVDLGEFPSEMEEKRLSRAQRLIQGPLRVLLSILISIVTELVRPTIIENRMSD